MHKKKIINLVYLVTVGKSAAFRWEQDWSDLLDQPISIDPLIAAIGGLEHAALIEVDISKFDDAGGVLVTSFAFVPVLDPSGTFANRATFDPTRPIRPDRIQNLLDRLGTCSIGHAFPAIFLGIESGHGEDHSYRYGLANSMSFLVRNLNGAIWGRFMAHLPQVLPRLGPRPSNVMVSMMPRPTNRSSNSSAKIDVWGADARQGRSKGVNSRGIHIILRGGSTGVLRATFKVEAKPESYTRKGSLVEGPG